MVFEIPSKEYLKAAFHVLNEEFFKSTLPVPEWDIGCELNVLEYDDIFEIDGYCCHDGEVYIIGVHNIWISENELLATLAHEMIHQYQLFNGFFPCHEGEFLTLVGIIESRTGWKLL